MLPYRELKGGLPSDKLKQVLKYIERNLSDGNLSLYSLAEQIHMSQYYFSHLFKKSMGITPYQYILQQRVERAKQLLKHSELTVTEIALECGFANQTHLTRQFGKLTGKTPNAYRQQCN